MNIFNFLVDDVTPAQLEEFLQDWSQLKWYIVPIFVIVFYIGISEAQKKHYSLLLGAFAFWMMDVFNELWNSWVYAATGAPVWGTIALGNSSFQILIGYNIEISFMFFILGLAACKMLKVTPGYEGEKFMDANKNYLTDPNNMYYMCNKKRKDLTEEERKTKLHAVLGRVIPACGGSVLAVIVECILNYSGLLTWEYAWWQPNCPWLIFLIGYCPFFFSAFIVHDLPRKKQLLFIGIMALTIILLIVITGSMGLLGKQFTN